MVFSFYFLMLGKGGYLIVFLDGVWFGVWCIVGFYVLVVVYLVWEDISCVLVIGDDLWFLWVLVVYVFVRKIMFILLVGVF